MKQDFQKDITVTSKGQLTLPVSIRRALKLGDRRTLRIAMGKNGVVTLRALPDVMSLFGKLNSDVPYDRQEKSNARHAMARRPGRAG
ncbi:MAG TPA: hypothetical protein VGJ15_00875 [Pirellulales bacterium]|jgi:bifunctional DNA-binding transcriptional regulator/antitoxin component of YhaV-PrlF toxin-antitoxin module